MVQSSDEPRCQRHRLRWLRLHAVGQRLATAGWVRAVAARTG